MTLALYLISGLPCCKLGTFNEYHATQETHGVKIKMR